MRIERPVPFRAGDADSLRTAPQATTLQHAAALAAGPSVLLADISEFQPEVSDALYLAWSKAIVIRAAYGARHDDRAWFGGQRRDLLHEGGVRWLGIYQYVVASQDVAAQAREFCRLIGRPRPGEFYIADIEEGAGNLRGAWNTWTTVVVSTLGAVPLGNYSGLNFAAAHNLSPVDWVAAYGQPEPTVRHTLWQFSSAFQVPGVGTADCSIFHGTIDDLAALAWPGQSHPIESNWTETLMQNLPTLGQGDRDQPGAVRFVSRIQIYVAGIGRWNNLGPVTAVRDDGVFGPTTTAAVKAVQKFFGLTEDGIVGPATWRALVAGQR